MNAWRTIRAAVLAALTAVAWSTATPAATAQTADDEGTFQEAAVDPSAAEEVEETQFDLQWSGGLSATTGNARTFAVNTGLLFEFKEGRHALRLRSQATVGYAAIEDDPATTAADEEVDLFDNEVARNIIGQLRYDFSITPDDAVFLAVRGTHDPFALLDFRLQIQPGYSRNFVSAENHRLWGELGYDATLDWEVDGQSNPVDQHSARAFLGYTNKLNPFLTYDGGAEVLVDVADAENTRVFWINALTSKVDDVLSLSLEFRLIFDNQPVEQTIVDDTMMERTVRAQPVDTRTVFSFILDIV